MWALSVVTADVQDRGGGCWLLGAARRWLPRVREVIAELAANQVYRGAPIVTEVAPLSNYWPAEDYHQDYFLKHPNQGYCAFVVGPKVEKFQKTFASRVKKD